MSAQLLDQIFATPDRRSRDGMLSLGLVSPSRGELTSIYDLIVRTRPGSTLEIGLALGVTATVISSAKHSVGIDITHKAVDPFQYVYNNAGIEEVRKAGFEVEHIPQLSEEYLPVAASRGELFDFIFVDGAHDIGHVVNDAFWSDRLLTPGGHIAFHDGFIFSAVAAVTHLVKEKNYSILSLPRDNRAWVRVFRYMLKLNPWYCLNVGPKMHRSLVILQKPLS